MPQYNALQRHTKWEELFGKPAVSMQQTHAVTVPCWEMMGSSSLVSRLHQLQNSLEVSAHSCVFVS